MQALHELKRTPPTNVRANKPRGTPNGLASPGDRSRCRSLQDSPEAAANPIERRRGHHPASQFSGERLCLGDQTGG